MSNKNKEEYNSYMNNYMKLRYSHRRDEAIEKLGGRCTVCGSSENLEFDHIDANTKEITIARGSSMSETRWLEEISKCQLLCHTCHVDKHKSQFPCNTPQKYWRGCRCQECKLAYREYSREYKRNKSIR